MPQGPKPGQGGAPHTPKQSKVKHKHSKSNCYPTNCQLWLDRQWVKPKWLRMMITLMMLLSLLSHLFLLLRTKHKVKVTGMNITQGSNAQHGRQLKSGPFASQYRNVSFR